MTYQGERNDADEPPPHREYGYRTLPDAHSAIVAAAGKVFS